MHDERDVSPVAGPRTVLVVDDDPTILYVLSSGLSRALEGFEVMTAGDGQEAIELMAQRPPSVLVTDLAMPVMDGFALISHVTHHRPTLPVVVLTGLAPATTESQLAGFGGLRVLRKPVTYQTVAQAVLDEIERMERGEHERIALAGVLQLVESERRNCTVVVRSGKRRGHLHFESGRLVNAFSDDFGAEGEAAAFDILGWHHTAVDLEPLPHHVRRLVQKPLQRLLAEVAAANAPTVTDAAPAGSDVPAFEAVPDGMPAAPDLATLDLAAQTDILEIPTDEGEFDGVDALTDEGEADGMDALYDEAPDIGSPSGEPRAMDAPPGEAHLDVGADDDTDLLMIAPAAAHADAMPANAHGASPTQPAGPTDEDHVSGMVAAIERLARRAREADEALAAVATEVETFREARRRFDEVTERRERRRQELEALRVDVAHLAREILGRVDRLFDPMQSDPSAPDAAQEPPPT
jgi:CheY-like chemotaxis protein